MLIPPFRERREDVPVLAEAFLARFAADYQAAPLVLSPEALQRLVDYDWPGNARELRNVIERVIVRVRNRAIVPGDLPAEVDGPVPVRPAASQAASRPDSLYDRLVYGQEPFWSAVYESFMERDLTRQDVRALVVRGLHETRGNYRMLVRLFNMDAKDYKRFLNVLHKHGCHIPVASFRDGTIRRPLRVPLSPSFETTRSA